MRQKSGPRKATSENIVKDISFLVVPIAGHVFFQEPDLQGLLGDELLQGPRLSPEVLDLSRGRLSRCIPSQPLLAGLQELLRPAVIERVVKILGRALGASLLWSESTAAGHAVPGSSDLLRSIEGRANS